MTSGPGSPEDGGATASHTLAYLRTLDKKLDLVLETQARHSERLGRVERGIDETRRDLAEIRRDSSETKSDTVLLENRILSAQTDILTILRRLEQATVLSSESADTAPR